MLAAGYIRGVVLSMCLLFCDSYSRSEICALSVLIATSEARLNVSKVQESLFHLFQHGLDEIFHIYEHNLMLLLIPWQSAYLDLSLQHGGYFIPTLLLSKPPNSCEAIKNQLHPKSTLKC